MHFQDIAFALFASGAFAAPASLVARDSCSDACYSAYNTCRSAPDANRSSCASSFASCLGYSPYDSNGSLVTPTACSSPVTSTTTAAPTTTADACVSQCNASYNSCRTAPDANQSYCASNYASCLGYSPFNNSGSFVTPTACSSSTVTTSAAVPTTTADACVSQCNASYNSCRNAPDANQSYCASNYASCLGYSPFDNGGSLVTPTACSSSPVTTSTAAPTSISGIPGGCNPAHPGSCPSSYFSTATTASAPLAVATEVPQAGANQSSVVAGLQWTVKQLTRYCSEDGSGCDYNFVISTNDGRADERCTVIRMPGKDAATESWYGIPCTTGSANTISWGYSDQFGANNAFAVMTVTNYQSKTNAYFGIAYVNENPVTPSSPAGSGNFGDIGPQPVYTF
ncbi:06cc9f74-c29a-4599-8fb4-29680ca3fb46-CDS [Sclerotinia trifoliorum]|uniref:06cc9f74-c29a-4599-8fb4-29680ca3fb46-CDS n=1 Tax=Sclerotinia trifoliorum TaxID=28548 RepID=A0A8H2VTJ9_9HELO|nr:06cc9f74-c29a-4599-8fb4-29680ca3fb46-CDS [Sclerotinia trifoliorum]